MKNRFLPPLIALLAGLVGCSSKPAPASVGQAYFQGMGCVKCHQIGEEGGTYGPNLTFVGFRKTPQWLDMWLQNPHAWRQKTVMPNFHFPDNVRKEIVEYLSAQKGQGFDKAGRPWNAPELQGNLVKKGEVIFNKAGCVACHAEMGRGGYRNNNVVGGLIPTLTKVSEGYTKEELLSKIKNGVTSSPADPSQPLPMISMPKWGAVLKDDEINAVIEFLFSLNASNAKSEKSGDSW